MSLMNRMDGLVDEKSQTIWSLLTASSLQWNQKERNFGWIFKLQTTAPTGYFPHTYNDWIADSKENIIQELKEYEQNMNYTTNRVDNVIVPLSNPVILFSNPVASNLKDSCAKAVGSNDDNIASIKIIDLTSKQVESITPFSLNTMENVYFNINPSSTCDVDTEMADLSSRQVEKYASISPYNTDDEDSLV